MRHVGFCAGWIVGLGIAGSRRVLATAVDDWSGKRFCVSSWYELTPTYNNALATTGTAREKRWRQKKSRPNEFA